MNTTILATPNDTGTTVAPNSTVSSTTFFPNSTEFLNITNVTTDGYRPETPEEALRDFWIGLALAVTSAVFTGSSFILKKKGLLNVSKRQATRAGAGGFTYLKEWLWWCGMFLMIVGEVLNFLAYLFAPATLVTPLGALSVITSAMMASYFLKEKLNLLGKIGCLLCILGSTLMVLHSPKEAEIQTMEELLDRIIEPGVIILCVILIGIACVLIFFIAPKYGQKNVLVFVLICSTIGSFTVMGAKGFGVAIKETVRGRNEFTNWLTYLMAAIVFVCSMFELVYLNKSLDTFNTAIVTPTYYVLFTSFVILFSLVLFKEFGNMLPEDITGAGIGFIVICCGIFMLNAFKNMNISLRNLPKAHKKSVSSSQNGEVITSVAHDDHHLLEDNENHSNDEDNHTEENHIHVELYEDDDSEEIKYTDDDDIVFRHSTSSENIISA